MKRARWKVVCHDLSRKGHPYFILCDAGILAVCSDASTKSQHSWSVMAAGTSIATGLPLFIAHTATRSNIIKQFRTHLSQAKADDVAVFQYCGHGARWKSAKPFEEFYPDGKDEGLVCFDSRGPGGFDLADKELAALLAELAKNEPHIAVILDCCHSGSATRNANDFTQGKCRQTHEVLDERPLESYLDGYYAALRKREVSLEIPASRHILLAACQRVQKAWEGHDHNGAFTSTLREGLGKSGPDISYADLFVRCRATVCRKSVTPPSVRFLGRKVYLGSVVILVATMRQGPTPHRVRELSKLFGADRQTIARWQIFWREHFPQTACWKVGRGRLVPTVEVVTLPLAILEAFLRSHDHQKDWERMLLFLSPITITGGLEIEVPR